MSEDFQREVLESLTELKTQMYQLVGNGQPGRIGKIEDDLEDLKTFKNKALGMGMVGIVLEPVLHYFLKGK